MVKLVRDLLDALKAAGSTDTYDLNEEQLIVIEVTLRIPNRSLGIERSLALRIRKKLGMEMAALVLLVVKPAFLIAATEERLQVIRKLLGSQAQDGDTQ